MPTEVEPRQYWVRSQDGKTWGPLTFATLDLFVTNQVIQGRCQVSVDGERFADPGRFPDVRDAFPEELWGSTEPLPGLEPAAPVVVPGGRPIPGIDRGRAPGPPVVGRPPTLQAPPTVTPARPATAQATPPTVAPARPAAAPAKPPTVSPARPAAAAAGTPLGDESIFRVYYKLAAGNATGALRLSSGGIEYELFLKKGVPHQVRSNAPGDSVLQYMGEKGLLGADAVTKAEAAAPQFGNDPVGAAFALGLVQNPGDFVAALSGHSVALLQKLMHLTEGAHRFDAAAVPPPTAASLGNKWALLLQSARALPLEEIRRRLGARIDAPVMKSGNLVVLEDLALSAQEARVAAALDGVRSLNQLVEALGDPDVVLRVGYALAELELAGFADVTPRPAAPPPPAPPPPAAPRASPPKSPAAAPRPTVAPKPAAAPARPVAAAPPRPAAAAARPATSATAPSVLAGVDNVSAASLAAVLAKLDKATHFEVLGLVQTATTANVKLAYLQMVKLFHPDTTPADADASVRPLREKIFARINDANTILSDEKAKANYLDELKYGGDEKVDMTGIFQAEDLFAKACIVCKARKYGEALKMFDEAIKLNDKDADFYAWRAISQFMAAADKKAELGPAMKFVDLAFKVRPKCAQAAYFAGQMHKLLGDAAAATKWFKKALELEPNHADAQRELRLMK